MQRIKAGRYLEDGIARWWADDQQAKLIETPGLLIDPDRPWLIGTPDFGAIRNGQTIVLEVKNVDRQFKDRWLTGAPNDYLVQIQLYMHLWGLDQGEFAVCFGGNELVPRVETKNEVLLDEVLSALEEWHERHIVGDTPPPMEPTEESMRAWRKLHPKDNGRTIVLPPSFDEAAAGLAELELEAKRIDSQISAIKASVMEAIGDNTFGMLGDGSGWSFKTSTIHEKPREARTREQRTLRRVKRVGVGSED